MKKIIGIMTALALLTAMTACGKSNTEVSKTNMEKGEISYPIDTDETIRYWVALPSALSTSVRNFGETEYAKELMKRTGVNIEYLHPSSGDETQALNLLIASDDLPDIIETNWLSQNPAAMIQKKVIVALNDYTDYMINLCKYLDENPDVDKQVKTDDGEYYAFPFIRNGEKLLATSGFMARSDWMEELNIEMPETIEDWENMLKVLKTKCTAPLGVHMNTLTFLCGGFGISGSYYVDNGTVKNGLLEQGYKEFLTTMKRWYDNGYIDKNAAMLDAKQIQSNILNSYSAIDFGAGGSLMGIYLNAKDDSGEEFGLTALPYPSAEKGVKAEFGNKQFKYSPINGAAITTKASNPELCARLLDYAYSEEGSMFNNFGIEGVSYEMKDGVPTYTELITNNPDGLAMGQALPMYAKAAGEGPFIQDERYIVQYYQNPAQKAALDIWGDNNHENHMLPQITLTKEESSEFARLNNAIETYSSEMLIKFIVGNEALDNYDAYIEQLKSMGIERCIEIEQNALDRFNAR